MAEVTGEVKKLPSAKAPVDYEIHPEMLRTLDIVGLSWFTCLFSATWRSGKVPLEWQTGVVVPIFKKRVLLKDGNHHPSV